MKYFDLDKQEKKIIKDFEQGKYKQVAKIKKEKSRYQKIAKNTLQKKRHIDINTRIVD